jgi:hypothetical protein
MVMFLTNRSALPRMSPEPTEFKLDALDNTTLCSSEHAESTS